MKYIILFLFLFLKCVYICTESEADLKRFREYEEKGTITHLRIDTVQVPFTLYKCRFIKKSKERL